MNKLALIALAAVVVPTVAGADEIDNWSFGGYLDFYYSKDLNHPDFPYGNVLRKFDIFNKDPKIAAGALNVSRKATRDLPIGLHLDFLFGRNADVLNKYEPGGENHWKNLRQAYVSWEDQGGRFSLDWGKFKGMMGVESSVSGDNVNYSRGFLHTLGQPSYHYGGRLKLALNDRTNIGIYAVNGWNEMEDSGDDMSFGGWLGFKGGDNWSAKLGFYTGDEGEDGGDTSGLGLPGDKLDTQVIDFSLKIGGMSRWTWAFNATMGEVDNGSDNAKWSGFAGYGQYKINDTWNMGLRAETFKDDEGIRTLTFLPFDGSSNEIKLESLTLNFDHHTSEKSMIRFEIRHDKANEEIFPKNDEGSDTRTTYSISWFIRW